MHPIGLSMPSETRRFDYLVLGSGIAGLGAAWLLSKFHRVTLYEKADRLGGTAHFSSLTTPMNGELVRYLAASIADRPLWLPRLGHASASAKRNS